MMNPIIARMLAVLALGLLLVPSLIIMTPEVRADFGQSADWDYPGREKVINDYEDSSLSSPYGSWGPPQLDPADTTFINTNFVSENPNFGGPYHGSKYIDVRMDDDNSHVFSFGKMTFLTTVPDLLQLRTITFFAKGQGSSLIVNSPDAEVGGYGIMFIGRSVDSQGNILESQYISLPVNDYTWHEIVFDQLYSPQAHHYSIELRMWVSIVVPGEIYSSIVVSMDYMRGFAPPSDVRFSYYNEYTGLGLQSELLIPEIYYDGQWTRVYGGHMVFGAGEFISYRVKDYFGQVVAQSAAFLLNRSTVYVDIPVKLVKVQIAKPDWWTSSVPPEWQLMYLPTGKQLTVSGWELELLAGWYNFRWGAQNATDSSNHTADAAEEIVVEEGSRDTYIDGNITASRSYTILDFSLIMRPTYKGSITDEYGNPVTGGNGSLILPDLGSWDGLRAAISTLADQIMNSTEYKAVMVLGFLMTIFSIVGYVRYQAKRKLKLGGKR